MKITSSKNNFQFSDNEYAYIIMSATQVANFNVGNPLKFDTLSVGNITLDPATYRVTLKKNRTYKLISHILVNYTNNAGGSTVQFYDVTAGAYIGTLGYELPVTYVANNTSTTPAFCIITPTVDTVVDLRLTTSTNINAIYTTYSHWEIQQINIVSPVIQRPDISVQVGVVQSYAGAVVPDGYLNCDGSAILRTVYSSLFAKLSTTWGVGDGATTFNIPDLRSATLRGVGTPTAFTSNTVVALAAKVDDKGQGHYHSAASSDSGHIHAITYSNIGQWEIQLGGLYEIGTLGGSATSKNTNTGYASISTTVSTMTNDGTNGAPRTGLETTGKAYGVYYIIKY